jgi:hypothetical protein
MSERSDVEVTQRIVSVLTVEQTHNVLEHLSGSDASEEFGPEYVAFVRGMLWRRLESFRRGRRGLVGLPDVSRPAPESRAP